MKSILLMTVLMFSAELCRAQQADTLTLTLEDSRSRALSNSSAINEKMIGLDEARAKREEIKYYEILPKLEFEGFGTTPPDEGSDIFGIDGVGLLFKSEIEFAQPLFTFGKISSSKKAAEANIEVKAAEVEEQTAQILLEVEKTYYGILLAKELLFILEDARGNVVKARNKIETQLEQGSTSVKQTDLFKVDVFSYEVEKSYQEVATGMDQATAYLKFLTGTAAPVRLSIADEYLDPIVFEIDSMSAYVTTAFANRAEVKQLRSGLVARKNLIDFQKSDYYPQLFLTGKYIYSRFPSGSDLNVFVKNLNEGNAFAAGLGVKLNLNFGQTYYKTLQSQLAYKKLKEKERLLVDGLPVEVEKAYLDMTKTKTVLGKSEEAMVSTKGWMNAASINFDLGTGSIKDLIDAYKQNSKIRAEYFGNIYQFNLAVLKLRQKIGMLQEQP